MNSIKTLETGLEDHLFEKVEIIAKGTDITVKNGAGFIPQGGYIMSKEEVESMARKKIAREIKTMGIDFGDIKIRAKGSNTIVEKARIIHNGYYFTNMEEVESIIYEKIFRDYMRL